MIRWSKKRIQNEMNNSHGFRHLPDSPSYTDVFDCGKKKFESELPPYSKPVAPPWPMGSEFLLMSSSFSGLLISNKRQLFFFFLTSYAIPMLLQQTITSFLNWFIYFWLPWVSVSPYGLSLVAVIWDYSLLRRREFWQWLLLLGSRCTGFSSCSTWAQ